MVGGIDNEGLLTVTDSSITNNNASNGGGIYSPSQHNYLHFNQIFGNTATTGKAIDCYNGFVNATLNWWGTNNDPSNLVYGNVIVNPWLVLNLTASPTSIKGNSTSNITAKLTYDNTGAYHNPTGGHVPDGIPISFKTSLGTITSSVKFVNGIATNTFKSGLTSGIAKINATLGNQIVNCSVTIDAIAPTVSSINPLNNSVTKNTNKTINITFSENIKIGSAYGNITVKNSSGGIVSIIKTISGKQLIIKRSSGLYSNYLYTVFLPVNAISDMAGNGLKNNYTSKFTVDIIVPSIKNVDPANNSFINNTSKVITVTFSEKVKAGSNFSKIKITNSAGGVIIILSKVFDTTGTKLIITRNGTWGNYQYTILLPKGSIIDLAGNTLANNYTSIFTVDTVKPTIVSMNPANNTSNVLRNKTITVTFSEAVKWGNKYIEIQANGSTIPTSAYTMSLSSDGKTLTIKPVTGTRWLANTTYTVIFHTGCVKDIAGNNLALVSRVFKTGST